VDPLRSSFDADPERYDRIRPRYPAELVDDLLTLGHMPAGGRVLEVGPGTGQLSVQLASRGLELTAVELGPALAERLRANLAPWPTAQIHVSAFEEWTPPAEPFHLVVCATAWHWLDPAVRLERAVAALRPGGSVALVSTTHVDGGDEAEFFVEAQECYLRFDPDTEPGFRLPKDPLIDTELSTSPDFSRVTRRQHRMELRYTTDEYVELLRTYSVCAKLTDTRREGLLSCLGSLIERRYRGSISMVYAFELTVGTLA
jgi:SAM-dependent methyltransferase